MALNCRHVQPRGDAVGAADVTTTDDKYSHTGQKVIDSQPSVSQLTKLYSGNEVYKEQNFFIVKQKQEFERT